MAPALHVCAPTLTFELHHLRQFSKLTLYETRTRFYFVGTNSSERLFRIAKVDRTATDELSLVEDGVVYSKKEIADLLGMIENGNKSSGGLRRVMSCFGIFGFVKFIEGYYMILITKRSAVALLGGHYIYHIDETAMLQVEQGQSRHEKKSDEARYVQIFSQVDASKNFYYSYNYDITSSLQKNMMRLPGRANMEPNDIFVWNRHLTDHVFSSPLSIWCLNIIHGFVDQSRISIFGHNFFVTLIARRSRHYAGARFLKRGANDRGYVANDVETEQIVHNASTTMFHTPRGRHDSNPGYTSFLQHRGSVPVLWSQEATAMAAKPQIELSRFDPFYTAAARHFNDMFRRYGTPIIVLNLVKSKEKVKRESLLLDCFTEAIKYLNQFLPPERAIQYIAWDMARASKSGDQDVIGTLEDLAEQAVDTTGFFHSGAELQVNAERRAVFDIDPGTSNTSTARSNQVGMRTLQRGVLRTNCVDCLDRTNAAQFVVGKCALGRQLFALGVITSPYVPFDCDAINLLNAMYHDHGDTIALQYGGSHLVNTMETYRKISPWTSHSRDMIESIRRYYSNSFTDAEKQDAINLFLGNYVPGEQRVQLWDLASDYFLHNETLWRRTPPKSYRLWWTPDAFAEQEMQTVAIDAQVINACFEEYYRPTIYTTFARLFAFNMIGTDSKMLNAPAGVEVPDVTPFAVRSAAMAARHLMIYSLDIGGVKRWMTLTSKQADEKSASKRRAARDSADSANADRGVDGRRGKSDDGRTSTNGTAGNSTMRLPQSLLSRDQNGQVQQQPQPQQQRGGWVASSLLADKMLEPKVAQTDEYRRYVQQFRPSSIALVPSFDEASVRSHPDYRAFAAYIQKGCLSANVAKGGSAATTPPQRTQTSMSASSQAVNSRATPAIPATKSTSATPGSLASMGVDGRDARMYAAYAAGGGQTLAGSDRARGDAYAQWVRTGVYGMHQAAS